MKTALRLVIFGVLLVGGAIYLIRFSGESRLRTEYNGIVERYLEAGEFENAIQRLEPLRGRGSAEVQAGVRNSLAMSYLGWAHAENATREQRLQRLRKAREYDPTTISEADQQLLDEAERAGR